LLPFNQTSNFCELALGFYAQASELGPKKAVPGEAPLDRSGQRLAANFLLLFCAALNFLARSLHILTEAMRGAAARDHCEPETEQEDGQYQFAMIA